MATTYIPDFTFARDRVRTEVADTAPTFTWTDEVIAYRLARAGFVGDPAASTEYQERPEILASIALIESVPTSSSSTGASVTIKQGSVTRTSSDGSLGNKDRSNILKALYKRLNALDALSSGDYGGPVVVDRYDACGNVAAISLTALALAVAIAFPAWARLEGKFGSLVVPTVANQVYNGDPATLRVYGYYDRSEVKSLLEASQEAGDYFADFNLARLTDVSSLIPDGGWLPADANLARLDKLGMAFVGTSGQDFTGLTLDGYGLLDYAGACVGSILNDGSLTASTIADCPAGCVRMKGNGGLVEGNTFADFCRKTWDTAAVYVEHRNGLDDGHDHIIRANVFNADTSLASVSPAYDGRTDWMRWDVMLDDGASDCLVENNVSNNSHGAICINGGDGNTIRNHTFNGGLVHLRAIGPGTTTIENCPTLDPAKIETDDVHTLVYV